jgi:hypothetical protein
MKKIFLILIMFGSLFALEQKENHFTLKLANPLNYPYLIKKYGYRKTAKIVKERRERLQNISINELELLKETYYNGNKINLGLTLAAILWQESNINKIKINFNDPSCGAFHKWLPGFARQLGISRNTHNYNNLCSKLMDFNYALYIALNDLNNLNEQVKIKNKNLKWRTIVGRYNGSKAYSAYVDFIRLNIFYLRQIEKFLKN